jgi:hypothetical protein
MYQLVCYCMYVCTNWCAVAQECMYVCTNWCAIAQE